MDARVVRRRIGIAVGLLVIVIGAGTFGFWALGLTPIDALFQTVTTVATVGFRPLFRFTRAAEVFTIVLVLLGVAWPPAPISTWWAMPPTTTCCARPASSEPPRSSPRPAPTPPTSTSP